MAHDAAAQRARLAIAAALLVSIANLAVALALLDAVR